MNDHLKRIFFERWKQRRIERQQLYAALKRRLIAEITKTTTQKVYENYFSPHKSEQQKTLHRKERLGSG